MSEGDYQRYYRVPKYVDADLFGGTFLCALAFLIASAVTLVVVPRRASVLATETVRRAGITALRAWLFKIYLVGAVSAFVIAAWRLGGPADLVALSARVLFASERGLSSELRDAFAPVAGLTSLNQLAIVIAPVEVLALLAGNGPATGARRRLVVVSLVAVYRGVLVSERLAIIEVAIPVFVLLLRHARARNMRRAILTAVAPGLAAVGLVLLFAGTEYFRSWQAYRDTTEDSLLEFSVVRLTGYYTTSFNNGALYADQADHWFLGASLARGPLSFPGIQSLIGVQEPEENSRLLGVFANPEFNNIGPTGQFLAEGGALWGVIVMTGFGCVAGVAYRSFQRGDLAGLVLFGIVTAAIWEFPRIWYLTNQRLTAPALGSLALLLVTRPTRAEPVMERS